MKQYSQRNTHKGKTAFRTSSAFRFAEKYRAQGRKNKVLKGRLSKFKRIK
jgi:hypothetical protein